MSAEPLQELGLGDEPRSWELPKGVPDRLVPLGLYLGQGSNPLEVAIALAPGRPAAGEIKALWEKRRGKRASPVLCVALYRHAGTWRAGACGPTGTDPRTVLDLDIGQVGRICGAALAEPDRHTAARLLTETLPEDDADLPGLRNAGMFATHELRSGVPRRSDWSAACKAGEPLLDRHGRDLVEGLGFSVERRDTTTSLLRADGAARAVAIFLQESESPEGVEQRYGGMSPASHALAAADREDLPYAVLTRGRQIRLYAVGKDVGVGRKGRAETYIELNLAVLPTGAAAYLPLIFGASALKRRGTFEDILDRSRDYATGLGERLRDRIYKDAVPHLAKAVAAHRDADSEPDHDFLYEQALVILFRLLFIAYAEDRDLLPYRASGEYARHALKTTARELAERLLEGRDEFDPAATDLWTGVGQLFRAVGLGNADWQVPAYGGSLFSSDPDVSRVGVAIADLELTNDEFGPALRALVVDRTAEGDPGPVDFRSLSVREFGTIYEGLLESSLAVASEDLTTDRAESYVPAKEGDEIVVRAGEIYLHDRSGARKATGSYFTKPFAVEHLLDHALELALDAHIERLTALMDGGDDAGAGRTFFDFRCADIAMGSGHFLVAAVDRIEARLSTFLAERPVPAVMAELGRLRNAAEEHLGDLAPAAEIEHSSLLRRQVARRCIYGVDRNLIAVELARLALWIHTFVPGLPLSFLDRTLVCGDSLTGVGTLDEAIAVLDPAAAKDASAPSLYRPRIEALIERTTDALGRLAKASDADAAEIAAARQALTEAEEAARPAHDLFDLVVAKRLGRADPIEEVDEHAISTHHHLERALEIANELQCLHFPLTFPEVFLRERPGFDCILGNPPWEKVKIEKHGWWAVRFPGLRGMPVARQNAEIEKLERSRADLTREFASEVARTDAARGILVRGPYPGIGKGDPDLYQAFAWRFWHLMRQDGAVGVVLPRSALAAAGSAEWRECVLNEGAFSDTTLLVNNRRWVFDEVHAQYTIALASIRKGADRAGTVAVRGPYASLPAYLEGIGAADIARFPAAEFRTWATGAAFPLLPSARSGEVFLKLRAHPRFDDPSHPWRARPVTELHSTNEKKHMILDPGDASDLWPVYKGASFDIWDPDTGEYYAWADPKYITDYLQQKRVRGQRSKISAFREMPADWVAQQATLPCRTARIVFRRISRATDSRTVRATLIPPYVVCQDVAPYLLWPSGNHNDEAFVLGVMSSIPFDWGARRIVEAHLDFHVLNPLTVPDRTLAAGMADHVGHLAARLAAPDARFAAWADSVGVEVDSVDVDERDDLIAELDAAVAHLYGLDRDDIKHIFETFHEGWDYSQRLKQVLIHYDDLNNAR